MTRTRTALALEAVVLGASAFGEMIRASHVRNSYEEQVIWLLRGMVDAVRAARPARSDGHYCAMVGNVSTMPS
ncbi:MAG: hypothetical protein ACXVAK_17890 [Vulcanimicrobiaceae bacterium]